MTEYKSQSARDAQASGYGSESYWQYLEERAVEYTARFPEAGDYFMSRNLGEALAGNDGE